MVWSVIGLYIFTILKSSISKRMFVRKMTLFISILILLIVILEWWLSNLTSIWNILDYKWLFNENISWVSDINIYIPSIISLDSISLYFSLLTGIIIPISILSNWYLNNKNSNLYYLLVLLIGILIWINFLTVELLSFYVLFESTLIPLFLIIGIYGSTNKDSASYYVLLYTLFGSLFMLLSICMSTYILKYTNYYYYNNIILSLDIQCLLWIGFFIAILIKSPLFPMHIWLPIVHSESPLAGSIILASLVLKLTIYLIIRWFLPMLSEANIIYSPFVFVICLLTIILISLITIIQVDLKIIIAYSSISHMGLTILGIFSNNLFGLEGSYILSLAHGFVSPGLFICVGGILYDRYHTRIIFYYNGLLSIMPYFSLLFIILSFANIGTPLSANFIGEFLSSLGAFKISPILSVFAISSILLSSIYQFKLTNRITSGNSLYISNIGDITKRESLILLCLIFPTFIIGVYPQSLINNTILDLVRILY